MTFYFFSPFLSAVYFTLVYFRLLWSFSPSFSINSRLWPGSFSLLMSLRLSFFVFFVLQHIYLMPLLQPWDQYCMHIIVSLSFSKFQWEAAWCDLYEKWHLSTSMNYSPLFFFSSLFRPLVIPAFLPLLSSPLISFPLLLYHHSCPLFSFPLLFYRPLLSSFQSSSFPILFFLPFFTLPPCRCSHLLSFLCFFIFFFPASSPASFSLLLAVCHFSFVSCSPQVFPPQTDF